MGSDNPYELVVSVVDQDGRGQYARYPRAALFGPEFDV